MTNALTMLQAMAPEVVVACTAFLVMALDLRRDPKPRAQGLVALFGLLAAALATIPDWLDTAPTNEALTLWGGIFVADPLSVVFRALACVTGALVLLFSLDPVEAERQHPGDFVTLVPFVVLGLMLSVSTAELLTFFLAFEILSLPLYLMAAWHKRERASAEAGLKYFVTGAVSSAVMLYGISLVFGTVGTTFFLEIPAKYEALSAPPQAFVLGCLMLLGGLCFKIAAAPFHMWAPDVYQGAPRPAGMFISTAPKAAMVAVLLRLFCATLAIQSRDFRLAEVFVVLFAALAILSMFWGNLVALAQTDIKRLMAYSGIAQIGYTLLGVLATSRAGAGGEGAAAAIYYVVIYSFANLAAWGVIVLYGWRTGSDRIQDYAGLARRSPFLAFAMLISFLSLAGAPPLAGFVGKFYLFRAVWEAQHAWWWLVLIGILNSVISLYYYFGVLKPVYFSAPQGDDSPLPVPWKFRTGLVFCLLVVVVLGLCPGLTRMTLEAGAAVLPLPGGQ